MLTEIWQSFKDNIKRRATNPFLGTFSIVYIFKNWELFYSLINFDPNLNLEGKLKYIRKYFEYHNFFENILVCVFITFGTLIATYLLLAFSRLLSNTYESLITPWIYKITDKSKVVLKEVHEGVKKQRSEFESSYEKEHEARIKIQTERDIYETKYHDAESKYIEILGDLNNLKASIESLNSQVEFKDMEIISLKKQSKDKDEQLEKYQNRINEYTGIISKLENNINTNSKIKNQNYGEELNRLRLENQRLKEAKDGYYQNLTDGNFVFSDAPQMIYDKYINLNIESKRRFVDLLENVREGTLLKEDFIKRDKYYLRFKDDGIFFDYKIEHDYYRIGLTILGYEVKNLVGSNFY